MFSPILRIRICLFTSIHNLGIILTKGFWRRAFVRCFSYGKCRVKFLTSRKGSEERAGSQCHVADTMTPSFQPWYISKCYKWANCFQWHFMWFPNFSMLALLLFIGNCGRKDMTMLVKGNRKPAALAVRKAIKHLEQGRKRLPVAFKQALVGSLVRPEPLSILDQYCSRGSWLMSSYVFPSLFK